MKRRRNLKKIKEELGQLQKRRTKRISNIEISYLTEVLELSQALSSTLDLQKVLSEIMDNALGLTQAQRGFIMLFDENGELTFNFSKYIKPKDTEKHSFTISRSVVNEVASSGAAIILNPVSEDKKFSTRKSIIELGLNLVICLPLITKKEIIGLIYLDSTLPREKFTNIEKEILNSFASLAALAINNARLWEASIKDSLTSLYNISYLYLRLKEECQKARRYKDIASFLLLDIDGFKTINDIHGHIKGNQILREMSQLLKNTFRQYDLVFRFGGDEFAVLLPSTNLKQAISISERAKKTIESHQFTLDRDTTSLSISIGITEIAPSCTEPDEVIKEADKLLYLSKSKDRCRISASTLPRKVLEGIEKFIGVSESAQKTRNLIEQYASTKASVLVFGETGTGKDLVARLIHELSPDRDKPFVPLECAALPETLFESELFGYERGAFTGAYKFKKGLLESAHEGTLFLDNIENLPLSVQAKILRAVEDKAFVRLGGEKAMKVDLRIIASTIKELNAEVKKGRFREDLYHRLNLLTIYLPPLKQRKDDILLLADTFLETISKIYKKHIKYFSDSAKMSLLAYNWPGNVRELKYRIERAVILNRSGVIRSSDLEIETRQCTLNLRDNVSQLQARLIKEALKIHKTSLSSIARELGISRTTLYQLMKKHGIKL